MSASLLTQYCKNLTVKSNYGENNTNQSDALAVEVWNVKRHRFEFDYESIPIKDLSIQRMMNFTLDEMLESRKTLVWSPPVVGQNAGTGISNPSVAATGAGATSVIIDGTLQPGNPLIARGDFIKFSNHSKVYMSRSDVSASNNILELNTPLKTNLSNSDSVITSNVEFTLIMDPDFDSGGFGRKAGDLYTTFSARFIEKL